MMLDLPVCKDYGEVHGGGWDCDSFDKKEEKGTKMSEQPKEAPKYELKTGVIAGPESSDQFQKLVDGGWRPDPVLMPTGRPNVVEGIGAIYHLIKLPEDREQARQALLDYYNSQPTREWEHVTGIDSLIHKREMEIKQAIINADHPLPAPAEEDVILETTFVPKGTDQASFIEKGFFVAHKDHISAGGTWMSRMGNRPKPKEPENTSDNSVSPPSP